MTGPDASILYQNPDHIAEAVDRELDADRRFFELAPDRSYRIRRAYPAELASLRSAYGRGWPFDDLIVYASVRQLRPGLRLRSFFASRSKLETDLSEEACRDVHDRVRDKKLEQRVLDAMASAGAL